MKKSNHKTLFLTELNHFTIINAFWKSISKITYSIIFISAILFLFSCKSKPKTTASLLKPIASKSVSYDHIVIVIEENKYYSDIIPINETSSEDSLNLIDNEAPYINKILKKEGANFTNMFAEEHYSEGNYFWLFSGSNQGVGFVDKIPDNSTPNYPFTSNNLASQLIAKDLSFKGYSESLPSVGFKGNKSRPYVRKHVPWISFANIPNGTTIKTSSNLRFKDFPKDSTGFKNLPTVSIVVPNLQNDMHDGSIKYGDDWLRNNLDAYYQWAKTHNSLLILTFDESNDPSGYSGLTDPSINPKLCSSNNKESCKDKQNKIVTIFAGAHIIPGNYSEGKGINHVNILRTIEHLYGLQKSGVQQKNAAAYGILDNYIITDVFDKNF